MKKLLIVCVLAGLFNSSCETKEQRVERERIEEVRRNEIEALKKREAAARAIELEQERIAKEIYEKYVNNSLHTGATPYAYCFGKNYSCSEYGCSQIKVKTPNNSDVLVTIKKNGQVYRHAYINSGSTYTFEFKNGTYQIFFYYGKGWNPNKFMKTTDCGDLKGGFINDEVFGKDSPQVLNNSILTYELIVQQSGNFSTKPSNLDEAF